MPPSPSFRRSLPYCSPLCLPPFRHQPFPPPSLPAYTPPAPKPAEFPCLRKPFCSCPCALPDDTDESEPCGRGAPLPAPWDGAASFRGSLFATMWAPMLMAGLLRLLVVGLSFTGPLVLKRILEYMVAKQEGAYVPKTGLGTLGLEG